MINISEIFTSGVGKLRKNGRNMIEIFTSWSEIRGKIIFTSGAKKRNMKQKKGEMKYSGRNMATNVRNISEIFTSGVIKWRNMAKKMGET